jgi:hypothetical protein
MREPIQKEDAIGLIIELLEPLLMEEEVSRLTPWLVEIEAKAQELMQILRPADTKALHPHVVAAAALYDAILHFESRTGVMIVFSRLMEATGLSVHRIQKVWKRFYDKRIYLDINQLSAIEVPNDATPSQLIPKMIKQIRDALIDATQQGHDWLSSVENEALQILSDPSFVSEELPEVTAAATIYESARTHDSKRLVHLPHRLLGRISGWGEAKIARVTKELFEQE